MHGGFGMGMGWMWIWPVLLLIVVLVLVRALVAPSRSGDEKKSPEEILRERYARGELDENEYRTRLEELRR